MSYTTRNSLYLRISKTTVLPTYVYLDERHVAWMSDPILQRVLSDLRPLILPKLKAEAGLFGASGPSNGVRKATVETHRGENYQFCYFIKKTEPHAVVIKSRNFRTAQQARATGRPLSSNIIVGAAPSRQRRKRKEAVVDSSDGDNSSAAPSRPKRQRTGIRRVSIDDGGDVEMDIAPLSGEEEDGPSPSDGGPRMELDIEEEEEEKPKPILNLTYQGFQLYGQCLCIVVEPWPIVRWMVTKSIRSSDRKQASFKEATPQPRAATPLFLPEVEETEDVNEPQPKGATSKSKAVLSQGVLDKIMGDDDLYEEEEDQEQEGGMMELSQILQGIKSYGGGVADDGDDMDGLVLFGDADEYREL